MFLRDNYTTNLETALQACAIANKQGYIEAKTHLKNLRKSIRSASKIISECIDGMKQYHINDKNIIQSINTQLQIVQTEFDQTYIDAERSLNYKKNMSSQFNITLFGKTKAGKSTLMEILTHGDGSHMGHGGQRTTRDVRSYEWKGMSVTDVPGIEAYGGQDDDSKAEEAAIYADLILFMITAGQPEGAEADWMIKLKKMDKPILCICNYKQSLGEDLNDFRLKRLLSNPEKLEQRMNINDLNQQFNTFLKEQLPNEHVSFIVSHLLAKFYSQQPTYLQFRDELERISRFSFVERAIINEVLTNGVLHRKKCYLSIIDAPLYQQMNQLYVFSSNAYSQFRMIQDKISLFDDWCENFNNNQKDELLSIVSNEFNKLRNSIPGFIEKHLEDKNVTSAWNEHYKNFKIQYNIESFIRNIGDSLEEKVSSIFTELKVEMKFSFQLNIDNKLGNYRFINWKRGMGWAGTLGSAGLGIAALVLSSNPLGWAALGVTAFLGFLSWLCDSREDKLRKGRIQLSEKLNSNIDKSEKLVKSKLLKWYDTNIVKQEEQVSRRLLLVGKSLLSLSNGERQLALGYNKNHKDITKMIIANIFNSMGISMMEFDRIICAARVPGRRIALVINGRENLPIKLSELSARLGNKEEINVIKLDSSKSLESQIIFLLKYFGFKLKPLIKKVNNNSQTVVYLFNNNYNQKELDSLDLIQQIMNVHIILK